MSVTHEHVTKQHLHPQSVAEISRHSVLSGDRIRQCRTSLPIDLQPQSIRHHHQGPLRKSALVTVQHKLPNFPSHSTSTVMNGIHPSQVVSSGLTSDSAKHAKFHIHFRLSQFTVVNKTRGHSIEMPLHAKEVYAVAFFKVVQQQTIGKVGNSIMCLWADNFCLQQLNSY